MCGQWLIYKLANSYLIGAMFMVLSPWQIHCETSSDSFDECNCAKRLPILRSCQQTWSVSRPTRVGFHPTIAIRQLVLGLVNLKVDNLFTIARRVEGWVNLGAAVRLCSPCPTFYTVNRKHTKMLLSYLPQNPVNSAKIWYTLSRINLRYSSLNVFQLAWIMSLQYLVKLSGRI